MFVPESSKLYYFKYLYIYICIYFLFVYSGVVGKHQRQWDTLGHNRSKYLYMYVFSMANLAFNFCKLYHNYFKKKLRI